MQYLKRLIIWLTPLVIVTLVFGTIYGSVQQSLRQGANDPQIALAQDLATKLDNGASPASLVGEPVDVAKSLSPAVIISDLSGKELASSAQINGSITTVPLGVLRSSQNHAYNAVTWQPQSDVRLASVSVAGKDYYVTAVRNLKEVEKREARVMQITGLGWLLSVATLTAYWCATPSRKKAKK